MVRRADLPPDEEVLTAVDSARREVRYLVTDFAVELITSKFREDAQAEGDVYVPEYQRTLAWKRDKMSYFIESLILRVPVPPIFFYEYEGKLEIVDGSQRIRTLVSFLNDGFRLRGLEKLDILNGFKYSELPSTISRRLKNTPLRSFVLDQGTDETTRIDLFRRLNTSGKKLQDAEIRKGAYRGPFLDLVLEKTNSPIFREVLPEIGGGSDPESERQELVTRFFVYSDYYTEFRHDVQRFLDGYMVQLNETLDEVDLVRMGREFDATMAFVRDSHPRAFYREQTGRRAPRVRFEAIAVGSNLALRENPDLQPAPFDWLESQEFEELVRTDASNSGPKLRRRVEFVRDQLLRR